MTNTRKCLDRRGRWPGPGMAAGGRAARSARRCSVPPLRSSCTTRGSHLHHRQHARRPDAARRLARDAAARALPEARPGLPQPRLLRRRGRDAAAVEELRHARRVAERHRPSPIGGYRARIASRTRTQGRRRLRLLRLQRVVRRRGRAAASSSSDLDDVHQAHARAEVQRQVGAAARAVLADRPREPARPEPARRQGEQQAARALHRRRWPRSPRPTASRSSICSARRRQLYAKATSAADDQRHPPERRGQPAAGARSSTAPCSAAPASATPRRTWRSCARRSLDKNFHWFNRYRTTATATRSTAAAADLA